MNALSLSNFPAILEFNSFKPFLLQPCQIHLTVAFFQQNPHLQLNLSDDEVVSSTLAAKVNAFLAGYNNFDVLKKLAVEYKLDDDVVNVIEAIARTGGDTSACHI